MTRAWCAGQEHRRSAAKRCTGTIRHGWCGRVEPDGAEYLKAYDDQPVGDEKNPLGAITRYSHDEWVGWLP